MTRSMMTTTPMTLWKPSRMSVKKISRAAPPYRFGGSVGSGSFAGEPLGASDDTSEEGNGGATENRSLIVWFLKCSIACARPSSAARRLSSTASMSVLYSGASATCLSPRSLVSSSTTRCRYSMTMRAICTHRIKMSATISAMSFASVETLGPRIRLNGSIMTSKAKGIANTAMLPALRSRG